MQDLSSHDLASVTGGGALHSAGSAIGFGAGVAVTAGLALSSKWSQPVAGQPEGFQRRHEAVLGPKVTQYSQGQTGAWRDFTAGVGEGATAAPGWTFRHGL